MWKSKKNLEGNTNEFHSMKIVFFFRLCHRQVIVCHKVVVVVVVEVFR